MLKRRRHVELCLESLAEFRSPELPALKDPSGPELRSLNHFTLPLRGIWEKIASWSHSSRSQVAIPHLDQALAPPWAARENKRLATPQKNTSDDKKMSNEPPPYTKQEWRHFVRRSLPTHIPTLPKTTLEDLKRPGREEVQRMYGSRNWEFCLTCKRPGTEYVLKKCGGCGAFPGNRALYCVRPFLLSLV
jgi:hypothetical protein